MLSCWLSLVLVSNTTILEHKDVFTLINTHDYDYGVCWEWLGNWSGRANNLRPYVYVNGERFATCRLVYALVHSEVPDDQVVRHTCDMGAKPIGCCNPYHMELGTQRDNIIDMYSRDRRGTSHDEVKDVRLLHDKYKVPVAVIVRVTGIARRTVRDIISGARRSETVKE